MSQNGTKNIMADHHKGTKCHSIGKMQQETGWKYVTDGQNVTNQVIEAGHDVTSSPS
jgi:hypothetical protein